MTSYFNDHPEVYLWIFFGGMLVVVTGGIVEDLLFRVMKSPKKRNWFSTVYPLVGLVPIYVTFIWPRHGFLVVLITAFIAFLFFLTVRTPRYCEKCGRSVYEGRGPPMSGVSHCPHCGAEVSRLRLKEPNQPPEPTR